MSHLADPESNRSVRILVVDGNVQFLQVATDLLQRWPDLLVVGTMPRIQDTLARIQLLKPHVILLDLDTPDLAGLESIPRLRMTMPGVGIIALTLSTGSAYEGAARAAGADALVSKAALLTDLLPAIQKVSGAGILHREWFATTAASAVEY